MALIKCPECGKEISDKSDKCIGCGFPLPRQNNELENYYNNPIIGKNKPRLENTKKEFPTARLIISIIMLVFSAIVLFQSCAAGIMNAIEDNGNADGGIGLLVFFCMITLGVIGVATKNTKSYTCLLALATFSAVIFLLCVFAYNGIFKDLKVWGWLFGIYSFVFSLSSSAVRYNYKKLHTEG